MISIVVRFSATALAGANAGLDLDASASRYAEALRAAIEGDFAAAAIDVARDDDAPVIGVTGVDDTERARIERSVTDLAWVVKHCAPWSVPAR